MRKEKIGFIGAGQMAEAIARGALEAGLFSAGNMIASDPADARRELFQSLGARATTDNLEVVRACRVIVIAVKPQNLDGLLKEIGPELSAEHLLVSICAGCPTTLFEAASPAPLRVVRAMPNLPMRVRMGATALCAGRHARAEDIALAEEIFSAAGRVVVVEEGMMDAVTALSGSGPAYFYFLVEVMIAAGVREGLSPEVAKALAVQTARGAAEMMATEDVPPEELRRRVTSKAGTTEAAFNTISKLKVREGLFQAIRAAAARARELGRH